MDRIVFGLAQEAELGDSTALWDTRIDPWIMAFSALVSSLQWARRTLPLNRYKTSARACKSLRIMVAANTMAVKEGSTSFQPRVLSPQSGFTQI